MSHHQSDCEGDQAQITSLTPEPEFSKSGTPLHMMTALQIEEEIPASDLPDRVENKSEKFDEDISIEEALSTL